ncbi:MAG TPA: hypothetical protein VGS19_20345 [Streptosporangiaceae bacterium]|nr:hypothetical protein [Streptosporangiaceae bacterium]
MVFVVDDLGAWLAGLLADASLKKLTALVLGSDQWRLGPGPRACECAGLRVGSRCGSATILA